MKLPDRAASLIRSASGSAILASSAEGGVFLRCGPLVVYGTFGEW
jgi:hypothetical protein